MACFPKVREVDARLQKSLAELRDRREGASGVGGANAIGAAGAGSQIRARTRLNAVRVVDVFVWGGGCQGGIGCVHPGKTFVTMIEFVNSCKFMWFWYAPSPFFFPLVYGEEGDNDGSKKAVLRFRDFRQFP